MPTTAERRVDVEALKRANPIVEVLARYGLELRPGGRALVGRCPFHDDRGRPNLHAYRASDPARDFWYCFRCTAGGDAISFVMRREGVGFAAACERLGLAATRPPLRLPPPQVADAPRPERRWERLALDEQVVMDTAAALYQHRLWREPRALEYLRDRGIPDATIRAAGLGYADGYSLEAYLRRRCGLRVAQGLGLLRRPDRADAGRPLREFLAGRIVVPELRGGHAIWFIGRQLVDDAERPKYLALSGARPVLGLEHAAEQPEAFLCEGVFDYLTARVWGLPAFSPCGTALPADRLGFLSGVETVYGVLDADEPGRAGADRFGARLGTRWRPLRLPAGCDLNDLGRRPDGRTEFSRLLAAVQETPDEEVRNGTRRRTTRREDCHGM